MKKKFKDYNFQEGINQALESIDFEFPLEIQSKVIPKLRKKNNIVGVCATGSGKTHAFLLPILDSVQLENKHVQAIIMLPTRELAMQIYTNLKPFVNRLTGLKVGLLIGSKDHVKQYKQAQIIIGTPGKLMEVLAVKKLINLSYLDYFIVDEADMIFDRNFIEQADIVLSQVQSSVTFALFSATITANMHPFIKKYFEKVEIITLENEHHKKVTHYLVNVVSLS